MNDVIPGATYLDGALDMEFHCNGITTDDGDRSVQIEYTATGATISVPYIVFQKEPTFEIVEQP